MMPLPHLKIAQRLGQVALIAACLCACPPAAPAGPPEPIAHEPGRRLPAQVVERTAVPAPPRDLPDPGRDPALSSALAAAVRTGRMTADLDYLATELATRHAYTPQMVLACDYALQAFEAAGYTAWLDPFSYGGHQLANVVAIKPGMLDPDRIYVIGGHLDSTSPEPQTLAPGADDNGTGAVAVLEIARLLAPIETDYSIYFVCFSAEEQGLVGSEHFAQQAELQSLDIRAVLTMDMLGYHDPAGDDLWLEGFYDGAASVWLMDLLEDAAETHAGLTVYRYPDNGFGSDHVPFHEHGYPAVLSIENEWDSNPCYHRTCDRVDRVDPWLWNRITAANAVVAAQHAQVRGGNGSITGTVAVAGGGDPADTELTLLGTGYGPQVTGPAGTFAWESVFPGSYTLTATRTGCLPVSVPIELAGGAPTPVQLVLEPLVAGTVRGTVRAPDGTPLAGALVEVEGQSAVALTGPDGAYALAPVWPGALNLATSLPDRMPRGRGVALGQGETATGVDFTLAPAWDFESDPEGLLATGEWGWGTDATAGAHSGARVWGTQLGGNHAHCADDRLALPPISLAGYQEATLRLWTWFQAESGDDGGLLEVSADGGESWQVIAPAEGYAGFVEGTCNPIDGHEAFTGTSGGWVQRSFDLEPFTGQWVRVRLHFGSDRSVAMRGWYVDDFAFSGTSATSSVASGGEGLAAGLRARLTAGPNPLRGEAVIRLELSTAQQGTLGVYAADGRRVARLAPWGRLAAGPHSFAWSGGDDRGHPVPAGLYWARWTAADGRARARLLVMR